MEHDPHTPAPSNSTGAARTGAGKNPYHTPLDISARLFSSLSVEDVLDNVVAGIGEMMSADRVEIRTRDAATNGLLPAHTWRREGATGGGGDEGEGPLDLAVYPEYANVLSHDVVVECCAGDPDIVPGAQARLKARGVRSELSARLKAHGEAFGVVSLVETRFVRRFTPLERDLFRQLCDLASIAVDNARAHHHLSEQQRHLEALFDICKALSVSLDIDELMALVGHGMEKAFGLNSVAILDYDQQQDALVVKWAHNFAFPEESNAMVGLVFPIEGGDPEYRNILDEGTILQFHRNEALKENDPIMYEDMLRWGELTSVETSLVSGGETLGVLSMGTTERFWILDDGMKALVRAFAGTAATALHNANMYQAALGPEKGSE